jgi:CPA2 family monovalent cation:H+ antiporter-2
METATFLQDLAVVMIVAGLVTILCHRLKQPVTLGYIVAGAIIGPRTPPFPLIHHEETVHTLAELGVILLMFSLGLEFSLRKLREVGGAAFIAAFLEILLMVWVGYEIGRVFRWSRMDSIFLGAMLSISSTIIIVKALAELGKSKERFAQLIFGILVIEDILAIAMIALLSGIAMTGSLRLAAVGTTVAKLAIFLAAALVSGFILAPRLLGYAARFKSNEMLLVTVLGLCFGSSLLAVKLGYSAALGAFLTGAIIAESRERHRVETLIEPVRDMFSAIFFVAIGLLIDPGKLAAYWWPIVVISLAVVAGKVATCSLGAFVGGNDSRASLRVRLGLAQIGEFSFIIAALRLSLKVTSEFLYPIAVAVSAVTTLLTPLLIKNADGMVNRFDRWAPRSLVHSLALYTDWVGKLGSRRHASIAAKLARRWLWQMALNVALITAVFIVAVFAEERPPAWLRDYGLGQEWLKSGLWLGATVFSLPMFIATARKLQALGLLIADTKVSRAAAGERTAIIRGVVAQVVAISVTTALGLYALVSSSTLLPRLEVLAVLAILAALLARLLRRSFIRIYSKAQVALRETLASTSEPREGHSSLALPPALRDADLQTVALSRESPAAGKRVRELALRTRTGASVVGIERGGAGIVNPGPDEEFQAGDHVLLLGSRAQLDAGRRALTGEAGV